MAIIHKPIALRCPQCSHDVARAVVSSYSIITVACVRCTYQWAVEIARLGLASDADHAVVTTER